MKTYELKLKINAPARKVVAAVTTKEYAEAEALADGAFAASSRVEKKGEKVVAIITDRTDPSRSPTGKKDPHKKEKCTITSEWNLETLRSEWKTKVPGMERIVKIAGSTWIEPDGDCCVYREKGTVSIGVPLIGAVIEKAIVADIVSGFPRKKSIIEKMTS